MKNYMPLTDEDERECIRKVQSGDKESFRSLVDKYKGMLKGYCIGKLHCPFESSEEVAWEVFGQAWRNIATFKYDSKFSTWLCAIAHNHYLNKCKDRGNQAESFDKYNQYTKERLLGGIATRDGDQRLFTKLFNELDADATQDCVQRQLGKVRPEYHDVICLVHMRDMSQEDAAESLGVPVGTIKSRLFRALKEARPFLKECL